ncbi:MAG: diaminopimelate decarboxylase [Acidobacteria bacterium]|nr:MAG: diaminopimelate decarboxylase [Acidobacteriota bacterium]
MNTQETHKKRPLPDALLRRLAEEHGTPLYVMHWDVVQERFASLQAHFDVVRYAQKANSNLALLRRLRMLGAQVDAVSLGEVRRALAAGYPEASVHFTADLFTREALDYLADRKLHANLGSPDMIEQWAAIRPGTSVTLRLNPGFGHGHDLKVSTGGRHSKHGIWSADLPEVLERTRRAGLEVSGLHMHIGSGSDFEHLSKIRACMLDAALQVGESLEAISAGGGLPTPYRPGDKPFALDRYASDWLETRDELQQRLGRRIVIEVEPGRYLSAEAGGLLTEVRATKRNADLDYVLVDAGFDNLVRPAMYGAYHHVSIVGKDALDQAPRVVAGPLCESADMITQGKGGVLEPRMLPEAAVGDLLWVHDAGAYAASMASNYNSRLLAAEVLVIGEDPFLVRRRQTIEQLLENEVPLPREAEDLIETQVLGPSEMAASGDET